ncbi:hypothetical protein MIND_00535800 [Mycena indigotica]|uniref:Low temperature viability protein n=1 Tax=Mycena indigotica TaxID=2126181 RepID=A0A8H6SXZ5_9AGAR|nr:uncharacterized protein MIND_00535800 [Mycena indigotica]KAF7307414.1 hypothetical protein MIND_00535800 [Mycena indigotica]
MPPKSIFRQPGAQHFQLVHRSQRDPLIHDPDASKHVLKPIARKGQSRADLEDLVTDSDRTRNIGEASLYGIYYDDSEYDYMQHLRTVGIQEEGVESVLIEAPSARKAKGKEKDQGISLKDLPDGVLASKTELPRNYESQQAIPASISGFQPDMDPHLRQVLEALEDDAFVDEGLEDDFFGELVGDGERGSDEEVDFEFSEEGLTKGVDVEEVGDDAGWEERFSRFKKAQAGQGPRSDDGYDDSEGGDTIGRLPEMSVIGGKGKRRRKGTSDASGYSMSSSSMYRNEALQTLDERFDQMILKQYNSDEESDTEPSADEPEEEDDDEAPQLITSRDDFESMMDEFLNDYEILGRKMKPKLEGDDGAAKLETLRRAMGQDERVRIESGEVDEVEDILMPLDIDDRKDRWDCETILTTYSNLENHPRLIRARDGETRKTQVVPKIHLDSRTGMPIVISNAESESSDDENERRHIGTLKRDRNESKEAKKARKQAVKEERQTRRAEKKATKEMFGAELQTQKKALNNKERKLKSL